MPASPVLAPGRRLAAARRALLPALATAATAGALAAPTSARAQTLTYLTDFTKTDNIYTNLNQAFPNTGAGVPGSRTGVANATFLYTPYTFSPGTNLTGNNGISFKLTSNATGQDFAQFGSAGFGLPGSVTVPVGLSGVSSLAFLVSAYNGVNIDVTLTGTGGSQTFTNIGIPDFNGGGAVNSCAGGLASSTIPCLQTAFQVTNVGAGGSGNSANGAFNTYNLVELNLGLSGALSAGTLTSVTLSTGGYEGLLLGATAVSPAAGGGMTTTPEPGTWALVAAGLGTLGAFARRRARA